MIPPDRLGGNQQIQNPKMYTIGDLTKKFSVSRSTILYYDSIGLLLPSSRSAAGYRLYSEMDVVRMERIMLYRGSGLPLASILEILERQESHAHLVLENQLSAINSKISDLRAQQNKIIDILGVNSFLSRSRVMTKGRWVSILEAAGFDEEGMKRWHIEFEKQSPEAHQDFLESLGIDGKEIAKIRKLSSEGINNEIDHRP